MRTHTFQMAIARRGVSKVWFCAGLALLLQSAGRPARGAGPVLTNSAADSPFVCQAWQVENGLPQNSVMAVLQSRDGYLWIGTANGLARFDGMNFKRFGLADGLPSLFVRVLLEDKDGTLWIGTANGLSRYANGSFTNWTVKDGLAGDGIMSLALAPDGTLWIGTTSGLCRRRNDVFNAPELPPELSHRYVRAVAADSQKRVWISFSDAGLFELVEGEQAGGSTLKRVQNNIPYRLLVDHNDQLLSAASGQIYRREGDDWKAVVEDGALPNTIIMSLTEASDGALWVGTQGEGLYIVRDGELQRVTQPNGLSDEAVQAVAEDTEKNIWVGTRAGGLNRLKPRQLSMWNIRDGNDVVAPLSLSEAADGALWVASHHRGFYKRESQSGGQFARVDLLDKLLFGALLITRDGSVWWGTASRLYQWREEKPVGLPRNASWLLGDAVRCLLEDRSDGLWIGTRDGKLVLYRGGEFIEMTNRLAGAPLTAFAQEPDGTLWVGSYGSGLEKRTPGRSTVYGRHEGLQSELIRALFLDSKDRLWIGTEGGGLSCLAGGTIHTLTSKNGLGDDTVVQIVEDDAGDIWLGTFHGIYQLQHGDLAAWLAGQTTRVQPRVFGQSQGMQSEQCALGFGTCLKTRDGLLCFSTDLGIAVIDPRSQRDSEKPPVVRLETVVVAGQARQSSGSTAKEVPEPLAVEAGKQQLDFQFTGLYYSAPERVRYRYRLEGLDGDWVEAGSARNAYYSYVPPGTYRFHVTAHNGNGVWSEDRNLLEVIVQPHYWETWWFLVAGWLGGVMLASGAVVAVVRHRLNLRMQALEKQRAVERERTRIAQDMHDELGSRLTKADMVARMVARDMNGSTGQQGLNVLRQTLEDMTITMDAVVWAVNPQHDTLDGLANYLIRFTQEFFAGSDIHCELDVPPDLPAVPLTASVRHNLFLAFKEALTNAAKHASPTKVFVRVEFADRRLVLEVKDDGKGFDMRGSGSGGRGLGNMRDRLRGIGGRCDVQSSVGEGTLVRFEVMLAPGV